MSHCWIHDGSAWTAVAATAAGPWPGGVQLAPAGDRMVLLSASDAARLNGAPVPAGLAVLDDRDEIRIAGLQVWFSTETLAAIAPYPAAQGQCPRCKRAIDPGTDAVRCPSCGVWHHEDAGAEAGCWTYAPTCACCGAATALDTGYRWTPEHV